MAQLKANYDNLKPDYDNLKTQSQNEIQDLFNSLNQLNLQMSTSAKFAISLMKNFLRVLLK